MELVRTWPFAAPVGGQAARTTVSCMAAVRYFPDYDLAEQYPYAAETVRRVWICKILDRNGACARPLLRLFEAEDGDGGSPDLRVVTSRPALGRLLPTQRYVRSAGLRRVADLADFLAAEAARDPWGLAEVRQRADQTPVTVTPPIVERLHEDDREVWEREPEYIVCDGNHRIVEGAWRREVAVAAVAAVEAPAQPYYTLPLRAYDWAYVAGNETDAKPAAAARYLARPVPVPAGHPLASVPPDERYRRYYRQLESGFGDIGTQGGP